MTPPIKDPGQVAYTAIVSGQFDRFLPQLDSAIRHRLRTRRVDG